MLPRPEFGPGISRQFGAGVFVNSITEACDNTYCNNQYILRNNVIFQAMYIDNNK